MVVIFIEHDNKTKDLVKNSDGAKELPSSRFSPVFSFIWRNGFQPGRRE